MRSLTYYNKVFQIISEASKDKQEATIRLLTDQIAPRIDAQEDKQKERKAPQ